MLNKTDELKDRVEALRLRMAAKFEELKADTRHEAIAAKDKLKKGLDELKDTLADGWEKASDKLHGWLDRHDDKPAKADATKSDKI